MFLGLINLVLRSNWYTFNSQLYKQIDEVAIGERTTSTTAKIYM